MTSPKNLVKNVICPDALLGQRWWGASKGLGQAIAQAAASPVRWCTTLPR